MTSVKFFPSYTNNKLLLCNVFIYCITCYWLVSSAESPRLLILLLLFIITSIYINIQIQANMFMITRSLAGCEYTEYSKLANDVNNKKLRDKTI